MEQAYKNNSIMAINAYKDQGSWMFDDERVGLVRELFVGGADTLLDSFNHNGSGKVTIVFSKIPFTGRNVRLQLMDTVENGEGGTTYFYPEGDHTVWLCPALLLFFPVPPTTIYARLTQPE